MISNAPQSPLMAEKTAQSPMNTSAAPFNTNPTPVPMNTGPAPMQNMGQAPPANNGFVPQTVVVPQGGSRFDYKDMSKCCLCVPLKAGLIAIVVVSVLFAVFGLALSWKSSDYTGPFGIPIGAVVDEAYKNSHRLSDPRWSKDPEVRDAANLEVLNTKNGLASIVAAFAFLSVFMNVALLVGAFLLFVGVTARKGLFFFVYVGIAIINCVIKLCLCGLFGNLMHYGFEACNYRDYTKAPPQPGQIGSYDDNERLCLVGKFQNTIFCFILLADVIFHAYFAFVAIMSRSKVNLL